MAECPYGYLLRHLMTHCHVLRRVLVRCTTIRACDRPLFTNAERAAGVCRICASGWTHPESYPLAPIVDAAEHARFSLRHWQAMQDQADTPADLARAAEGIAVWSVRVMVLSGRPCRMVAYQRYPLLPRPQAGRRPPAVRTRLRAGMSDQRSPYPAAIGSSPGRSRPGAAH